MTWLKIDDAFGGHPKVLLAGNEAVGLWVRCASWSSAHMTDGFVPEAVVLMYGSKRLAQKLVAARLFEPRSMDADGSPGYLVHDFLLYNPSRNEVESERARRNELRDPELVAAVKERDGNACRYCGVRVKWTDRRGPEGGTLDHVVPGLAGGIDNVVVACRGCNGKKKNRTPAEAGLVLLPPPGDDAPPTAGATTGPGPRPSAGPRSDLGRTRTDPDPEADAPGRVGSGQDEAGSAQAGTVPVGSGRTGSGRRRNRDRIGTSPRRPAEAGTVLRAVRTTAGRCPVHHVDNPCQACTAAAAS